MKEKPNTPVDANWRTPDALWPHFQKVLPKPKGGRPRMDDRQARDAIFYVLRTGCQWKAGLLQYDIAVGIDWEWQAMDRAMTKAPLGEKGTGPNPTDRAKSGTKRSLLTDGAGIPVGGGWLLSRVEFLRSEK